MVGLSDIGLYSRTLLVIRGEWTNCIPGQFANNPPKTEPLVTIALDLSQGLWIARGHNWQLCRGSFMKAVSGKASKSLDGVCLYTASGREPVIIHQYFMNDAPRREGPAFRGFNPNNQSTWAQRTYWWRYDDPSIMTPFDRMAEMFDRAVRSEKMKARLREQFGSIIDPEVLLPIVGTLLAMFGAEIVGGAAFVMAIGRLMGIGQFACDYYFYEPRLKQIHHYCMYAQQPKDLDDGADMLEEILVKIIGDLATALGIHALSTIAMKLFSALMTMAPKRMREIMLQSKSAAEAYIRGKPFGRRDLLLDAAGTPLERPAIEMYKRTSAENREVMVVREPDAKRGVWVNSHIWNRAKPVWLKAKSYMGWHGLVCLEESGIHQSLHESGTFDLGNLRGASVEIDTALATGRRYPKKYRLPKDGPELAGIDYSHTGKNNIVLDGHYLVDMRELGGGFMLVDSMGNPYASDLDLATRQRPGMSRAGQHLKNDAAHGGNPRAPEDNFLLEYDMNKTYQGQPGANPMHDPSQHGGGGASVVHAREGRRKGTKHWTPREPDGSFKPERLVVFLPEWNSRTSRIESNMYVFGSWGDFQQFAHANNLEFPF